MTHLALVQLASNAATESAEDRTSRALELTRSACAGTDMVVLPELWLAGAFDIHGCQALAQPLDGPLVTAFADVAASERTWLHMGSFPERDTEGRTYNTSVVFDADGDIAAIYRKVHLFGFDGGEPTVMSAGDDYVVVDTPLGRTGLATCYDLRFPEQFRALVDAGAESFLISSGWPTKRIEHWRVLLRARAIEDLAWVIACNGVGTQGATTLGGRSAIIDPLGDVVVEAAEDEEILHGSVDTDRARQWRETFPALGDRV